MASPWASGLPPTPSDSPRSCLLRVCFIIARASARKVVEMVNGMRSVVVDKVASVTQACGLSNEVRIATDNIPSEEGVVVVVEVLTNKSTYNILELTSGRMAKVVKGDIVV